MPDAVGNLFKSPDRKDRTYGRGCRLSESKTATYDYDKLGNLIRKREKNGNIWEYQWSESGMLEKVLRPDGGDVIFAYDALGRRLWKRYKKTITKFIWDGNRTLHEWKEFDTKESTADEIITWVFSNDNFNPTAKIKGNKKYSIIADHLGTPIQGYNDDLIWQREIDSYGNSKMQKGEPGFCNFLYQGQTLDVETELAYNRFRYYNPDDGIYISQDPIRLKGGRCLYGYVTDVCIAIDPLGLAEQPRNPKTGKFGPKNPDDSVPGSDAATEIKTKYENDPNYVVKGEEISFKDPETGQLRRYDLVVEGVDGPDKGKIIGVETKTSEDTWYGGKQKKFDDKINVGDSGIIPVGKKALDNDIDRIDGSGKESGTGCKPK